MVTKRFSRTDSTENQSCLQLLRRCTYQVTSRLSSCLTTTLLTCQLISLLRKHSACFSRNFIAMNFIVRSTIINALPPLKVLLSINLLFAACTDPGFCSHDMPSPFKDLSGSIFCFMQIVSRLEPTQLNCLLRNSAFYFFKNTLQFLVATVTAYFLNVGVSSIAQCKDPTPLESFPKSKSNFIILLNKTIKTSNLRACVSWSFLSERGEAGEDVGGDVGVRISESSLRYPPVGISDLRNFKGITAGTYAGFFFKR